MIDLKNDGDVAIVTIRHGKANALDIELCEGLAKCFEELRRSDARAVVVTGQGRIFSAGVDLIRVSSAGADYVRAFLPSLRYLPEFTFGAATYDTDAALQRGWVDTVVSAGVLMGEAMAAARQLARLSPAAFTQAKKQLRQGVIESVARSGSATDKIVTDIWAAPESLGYIRDYVARTLKKT
jgi:enoyl-CoA hydratase/carnithine racemase